MAAPMTSTLLNKNLRKPVIFCLSHLRNYARSIRQPVVKIMNSEEEVSKLKNRNIGVKDPRLEVDFNPRDPVKRNLPKNDKRTNKDTKNKNVNTMKVNQVEIKKRKKGFYGDTEFEILGDDSDGIFGKAVMKVRSKNSREKNKEIILEGRRLILDALNAGGTMKGLYFSGNDVLNGFPALSSPVYKVSYNSMKIWSDTETPSGLLAIFERPKEGVALCGPENPLPLTLIMDQVRDPGNMGTLIRSAAAVGCKRILAVKGCVDVWESKVLRAGAGSHFRIPIMSNLTWERIPGYISESSDVFIADLHRPTEKRVEKIGKSFISTESLKELLDDNDEKLAEESSESDESETEEESDSESDSDTDVDEMVTHIDKSYRDSEMLKKYENVPLPVKSFQEIEYSNNKPKVLIIGGETTGISSAARKLAFDNCGTVITIPMCAGVNSLNTSIAGSVILYEMFKYLNKSNS